jgi:arabinofuranosyltransferase
MNDRTEPSRSPWLLMTPILAAFLFGVLLFRGHYADDALIACRYAENLVSHGQLVYNLGEPVSSLTSPLHAFIYAGLYCLTGETLRAYQAVAFVCLILSVALVIRSFSGHPYSQIISALTILPLPCVILWSFGGLETILLLLLVTLLCLAARGEMTPSRLCVVTLLAGICFVTRYDSCLFAGPVVLWAFWKSRKPAHIAAAAAVGALMPIAWLIFAKYYYGDIFPTSFYVKASLNTHNPQLFAAGLWKNFSYMAQFTVLTGLLPAAILALVPRYRQTLPRLALRELIKSELPLILGLAMVLAYGMNVATAHMMYSFRILVPYVPALAILASVLFCDIRVQPGRAGGADRVFVIFVLAASLFQAWQSWYTYSHSTNGAVARVADYEWTSVSVKAQEVSLANFRKGAKEIRDHWQSLSQRPDRQPRVWTIAGGTTPYYYMDAYIFEALASYRRFVQPPLKPCADYIQVAVPEGQPMSAVLPGPESDYTLVSVMTNELHPQRQQQRIYFNAHPLDNPLPPRVNDKVSQWQGGPG